jgi:DNA-binding NarL/FixJ family response regulator
MNVLICDDHCLFADALASVFRARGYDVRATVRDPPHAVASLINHDVDICLMDLMFPNGVDGSECLGDLRAASPTTKVIVVTASSDVSALARAAESGVAAIVFKDEGVEQIIEAVEHAQAGKTPRRPPENLRRAEAATRRGPAHDMVKFLTSRERETLERLVRGETGTQLAANMGINYATARTHVQNVLTKLGVHSRLEAVAFAISNSLVDFEGRSIPPDRD